MFRNFSSRLQSSKSVVQSLRTGNGAMGVSSPLVLHQAKISSSLTPIQQQLAVSSFVRSFHSLSMHRSEKVEKTPQEDDIIMDDEEMGQEKKAESITIEEPKVKKGEAREHLQFQAETKQLLDIVATALYTDKDVFIRELISNASDALEKCRQAQLQSEVKVDQGDLPLQIKITLDEKRKIFCIEDTGIGMTKEELIENIGTIAKSGSKAFIQKLKDSGSSDTANIIGQFGVGFYSSFMVSENVKIYTKSFDPDSPGYCWESHGSGSYNIYEAEGVTRGTKIIMNLKDRDKEFSMRDTVERIIKKYSNFVQYPIYLNNSKVSTLDAIWLRKPQDITPDEHKRFYQYINRSGGEPLYTIQFTADVPLNIHSLFYIPSENSDMFGSESSAPDINVYSKKVLIKAKHREVLPEWLRFLKGAVDSEDLPLNISRESLQNSPLVRRINAILTRKVLQFFKEQLKEDREKYVKFYNNFHGFLKEGILRDYLYKDEIADLLIFQSTNSEKYISLKEYVEQMKSDQKEIYFVVAPSKQLAVGSPYYEAISNKGFDVLLLQDARDEAALTTIMSYDDKEIKSIESADIEIDSDGTALNEGQVEDLVRFFKSTVDNCQGLETTRKLSGTPAIIKNPDTSITRHMKRIASKGQPLDVTPQTIQVDPRNPLIISLHKMIGENPDKAEVVANQIFDHALISAGLIDDARYLLPKLREVLQLIVNEEKK
uniref:Histidine kinase/HSP90-like ATPase domain-containing protein n=2 Tax=Percolomonas cosmopolitus TaxID=63605 RepID=A0A7S1KU88_9EUKA|mmetsp:Transcript_9207/g.34007  ORF Transcript_9207/g.34007 Transcript_9207/m.34007 type:complete len:715 (+) Transcript_9207:1-2145(+)